MDDFSIQLEIIPTDSYFSEGIETRGSMNQWIGLREHLNRKP